MSAALALAWALCGPAPSPVAALRVADAYWREGDRVPGMRAVDRAWTAYRCARDEGASEAELAPLAHAFAVAVLAAGDG